MANINTSVTDVLQHLGIEYIRRDSDNNYYMVTDSGEKISCDEFFKVVCMHLLQDTDELYVDK
nr:MAG TPA: ThiS family [Caudoviricetes sp.]